MKVVQISSAACGACFHVQLVHVWPLFAFEDLFVASSTVYCRLYTVNLPSQQLRAKQLYY